MNCEKLSYYRMVIINKSELNRIIKGEKVMDIMPFSIRNRLRKRFLFIYISHYTGNNSSAKRSLYPSCLTRMILAGMFDEDDFME